jgi:hypothetical protein
MLMLVDQVKESLSQITAKDEIVKGDVPLMRHLLARQDKQS